MKKTRCDAMLLNLPEDRQEQIIEWIETPKSETCPGGYQFAREQLAADGLSASLRALSHFYSSYRRKEFFKGAYQAAEDQKALMLEFDPANVDRAEAFGDYCFLQESLKAQDPKTFVALGHLRESRKTREQIGNFTKLKLEQAERKIAQKDEEIRIMQEKFKRTTCELFLKWNASEQARQITGSGATNAEKIQQLGRVMFGEDWDS